MPLTSHVSQDLFLHIPQSLGDSQSDLVHKPLRILFFITGNPGLIGYYHPFLSLLAESEEAKGCVIYGASLGGFEIEANLEGNQVVMGAAVEDFLFPKAAGGRRLGRMWGLREQVELCMARVDESVKRIREEKIAVESKDGDGGIEAGSTKVILMGHSVGAWIALEMIRLSQSTKEQLERADAPIDSGSKGSENGKGKLGTGKEDWKQGSWEIEAAVLLTPTIMDLPLSDSGRIAGPLLGNVPYLPVMAQWGSTGIKWLIGERWLRRVVSSVTGMQEDGGNGLDTTVKFLLSERGVKQSLFLARDELSIIRGDAWGEEVWGVLDEVGTEIGKTDNVGAGPLTGSKSPRLYFLFAENDHWVADETRKKILEKRGKEDVGNRLGWVQA